MADEERRRQEAMTDEAREMEAHQAALREKERQVLLERERRKAREKAASTYGHEEPLPGREQEYEAYKALESGIQEAGGPAYVPPPIDEERRNRSPGLQHNFYDVPTSDFKRPYGMSPGAPGPPAPEEGSPAAYGAESPMPGREQQYAANNSQGGGMGGAGPYVVWRQTQGVVGEVGCDWSCKANSLLFSR